MLAWISARLFEVAPSYRTNLAPTAACGPHLDPAPTDPGMAVATLPTAAVSAYASVLASTSKNLAAANANIPNMLNHPGGPVAILTYRDAVAGITGAPQTNYVYQPGAPARVVSTYTGGLSGLGVSANVALGTSTAGNTGGSTSTASNLSLGVTMPGVSSVPVPAVPAQIPAALPALPLTPATAPSVLSPAEPAPLAAPLPLATASAPSVDPMGIQVGAMGPAPAHPGFQALAPAGMAIFMDITDFQPAVAPATAHVAVETPAVAITAPAPAGVAAVQAAPTLAAPAPVTPASPAGGVASGIAQPAVVQV
jgi:hypothetical protein